VSRIANESKSLATLTALLADLLAQNREIANDASARPVNLAAGDLIGTKDFERFTLPRPRQQTAPSNGAS
jgi:hypothetical protein